MDNPILNYLGVNFRFMENPEQYGALANLDILMNHETLGVIFTQLEIHGENPRKLEKQIESVKGFLHEENYLNMIVLCVYNNLDEN